MTETKKILINKRTSISNDEPFTLIAGPCTLENKDHGLMIATKIKEICSDLNINYIFKASFDKANRTSLSSSRGIGIDKGLEIFQEIKKELEIPLISDVHEASQCSEVGEVVDILQIPAFLSRQTDLLLAAGKSERAINIKKGQFMAPWDMSNVVKKIESTGNDKIMLCERGTSFGYNTLVCDFRGLNIMSNEGYPIIFDATHSVQSPSGQGGSTGGQREYAGYLARAAVSLGVAGLFIETHDDPDNAPSDGPNMIPLKHLKEILTMLKKFDTLAKQVPYDCHKYKSY